MSIDAICHLPVWGLSRHDGSHLWMWSTWPKLREGSVHRVMKAWGYEFHSHIIWNKVVMGLARYVRTQTEVLCFGVKGKAHRHLLEKDQRDIVTIKRSGRHSEKPEEFRRIVERLSPGPRIELFARHSAPGWDRWGSEAPDA